MRTIFITILVTLLSVMASAQNKITLAVDGKTVTATLADNAACGELVALLEKCPISINMTDYGGFEKVGALPQSFTTSNSEIDTEAGDIMLYQGNQMVIFYGTNAWSYTRLGRIDNATAESVSRFLGKGNITLTVSLSSQAGIDEIIIDRLTSDKVYDLNGRVVSSRPLPPGLYLINGKKTLIK